jgi:hypothetical protein
MRLAILTGVMLVAIGCGGSAGSPAPSTAPTQAGTDASPASSDEAPTGSSSGTGPIGGDIGDRSKGSVQAQITGGLTSTVDLPFGAPAARFLVDGPGTAYLPYTDAVKGTMFLTVTGDQLAVQFAGPDNVALANGGTPCALKLDALDADHAKGSFTCKGMMLIQGDSVGTADVTGTFEGHR